MKARKNAKLAILIFIIGAIAIGTTIILLNKPQGNTFSVSYAGGENNSGNGQRMGLPLSVVYDRSCSPDAGYNYCYEYQYEYCYGNACPRPTVKMQFYDPTKDSTKCQNGYCIGDVILKWKVTGADNLYLYNDSETNWKNFFNKIGCYKDSCNGGTSISKTGEMVLAKPGQPTLNYCPKFVGIDYDYKKYTYSGGSWESAWAYAYLGFGWTSTTTCNFYSTTCLSSTNFGCASNEYCLGNSQCLPKECDNGQNKLNDTGFYQCTNYKWQYKGNCQSGSKCVGMDSYSCVNYNWKNNGKTVGACGVQCLPNAIPQTFSVSQIELSAGEKCEGATLSTCSDFIWKNNGTTLGKCGVECKTNNECADLNSESQPVCQDGDLFNTVRTGSCNTANYKCETKSLDQIYKKCNLGCSENLCFEDTASFKIFVGVGILILSGVIVYIYYYRHKKGRRRR